MCSREKYRKGNNNNNDDDKIHLHSRETRSRNKQMLPKSTRTRIDDQRKVNPDPKKTQAREPP